MTVSVRTRHRPDSSPSGTVASLNPEALSRAASVMACSTPAMDLRLAWWARWSSAPTSSPSRLRALSSSTPASWSMAPEMRWITALRARAGKISSVAATPIRLPITISTTRQAAAIRGSMWAVEPPTSTMAAVIGATFRLGRTAAAKARSATAADRIRPSSTTVLART